MRTRIFVEYLNDDDKYIDYTYLWDIICKNNKKLFRDGLNLIILEIENEDITDNIKLICPKQNYSNEFLSNKKKSLILIKRDKFFEPVYVIKDSVEYIIKKTFVISENLVETQFQDFNNVLITIKNLINDKCISEINSKKKYTFKKNLSLSTIINQLNKLKEIEIIYQVMDYNGKIIGLILNHNKMTGYLPCYPSGIMVDIDIPFKFFDDIDTTYYNDYNNTKVFLNKINLMTNYKIICKPVIKIIDDEVIVGLLTEGNQYVPIKDP